MVGTSIYPSVLEEPYLRRRCPRIIHECLEKYFPSNSIRGIVFVACPGAVKLLSWLSSCTTRGYTSRHMGRIKSRKKQPRRKRAPSSGPDPDPASPFHLASASTTYRQGKPSRDCIPVPGPSPLSRDGPPCHPPCYSPLAGRRQQALFQRRHLPFHLILSPGSVQWDKCLLSAARLYRFTSTRAPLRPAGG